MKSITQKTILLTMILCITVACGMFVLLHNSSLTVFAKKNSDTLNHINLGDGIENYTGYGCDNGVDLQNNVSGQNENFLIEESIGFGCGSFCGTGREG